MTGQKNAVTTRLASAMSYAPHGALSSMTLGNGLVETRQYGLRLQPSSVTVGSLLGLTFDYCSAGGQSCSENNGNLLRQTITPLGVTQSYTGYDGANRLVSASETGSWQQAYGYDNLGNRWVTQHSGLPSLTLETPVAQSWYGSNNRISTWGYDNAGNVTSIGSMQRTFSYDAENRQISGTINGQAATYEYDGEGRRVKKVMAGTPSVYVYDALGNLAAEYTTGTPVAQGAPQYVTPDHLGSVRLVTNASGDVVSRHDYLPFGEEIPAGTGGRTSEWGVADGVGQRFTGKERDGETGLDYFKARYLSSAQGRFTSVDPENRSGMVPDPQSWNGYAYGRNNPLKYVDPDGERYRVCDSEGKNCADISDQEFYDFQQQNKNLFTFTGKGQILNNGNLTGTFQQTSVDLDPLAALVLRSAGETADREIKQFAKDVAISTATGFVLGGVFQGAQAAGRLLPFKDARLIQKVNNVLDELASGRRSFQKAREFLNDGRAGGQALPAKGPGYYREFTVQPAPGVSGRGAERLVVGQGGEVYYTPNHYGSFVRIQ